MLTPRETYLLSFRIAVVSGVFTFVVCVLLLADYAGRVEKDPLNAPGYLTLKEVLAAKPQDAGVKTRMREMDVRLRYEYFERLRFTLWGTWLLLGGAVLTAAAATVAATLHTTVPKPEARSGPEDVEEHTNRISRWAVGVVAGGLVVLVAGLYFTAGSFFPSEIRADAALPAEHPEKAPQAKAIAAGTSAASARPLTPAPAAPKVKTSETGPRTAPKDTAAAPKDAPTVAVAAKPIAKPSPQETARTPQETARTPQETARTPQETAKTPQETARTPQETAEVPAPAPSLPSLAPAEIAKNWPRFRGPNGLGISPHTNIPQEFNGETGQGVLWKTAVPLPGRGSPIVWSHRVFVTGADETQRVVYCLDADSGQILWQTPVPGTPESTAEPPKVAESVGFAASTPTTDGRRVYAIFANGDVAAVDYEGQVRWSRSLGLPKNSYGHASSLAMYQDLVIVQFDQGTKKDGLSKLLALQAASGETAWEAPRPVPNSWPTPLVIEHQGQPQIITAADPWVIAYSPTDGKELWRVPCLQADVGPSPTFADGIVYAANEFPGVTAIRVGGTGDLATTNILWEADVGAPDCASPVATDKFVLVLASYGILTCYNAKEGGEPLWEEEFEDANFTASPSLVGPYVYLVEEEGKVWVVEPTEKECKRVAEAQVGEACVTSPAFQEGRIYIRGERHLFCMGRRN